MFFNTSFFCLFLQIVARRRASPLNDKSCVKNPFVIWKANLLQEKKNKHVIFRLYKVGPYGEKLWPWAWKCCPRSQFFTIPTSQPASNIYVCLYHTAFNYIARRYGTLPKEMLYLITTQEVYVLWQVIKRYPLETFLFKRVLPGLSPAKRTSFWDASNFQSESLLSVLEMTSGVSDIDQKRYLRYLRKPFHF